MAVRRKLAPLPFTCVKLSDRFWAPRVEVNRTVTLPAEYAMCESTGRIAAFDLKWTPGDPNPPHIFWDSDVAKWIEAASYALATHPDRSLDDLLDRVIARIAKAQQPDGYLNTHYIVFERAGLDRRWTNLRDNHELYCAGHLIEAAVAHYQATGKPTLLEVACRYADYIDRVFGRGRGKLRGYCGHEEIELALVKLYRVTAERRYLRLAQYFVDERGRKPHYFDIEARKRGEDPARFRFGSYEYNQSHIPVREQRVVTGHAVRAMYLYSAMADLAGETGDASLLAACERIWHSVVDERMYITGGIGPSASNEGFTVAYDLPDETAYAETCAAIGMVFWNHRMLQFDGDGRYADVMERALYNGTISGVSLDGTRFFYENPLASPGDHHRQPWFDCACCPPNIARLIASVGGYFYSTDDDGVWAHLYAAGDAVFPDRGLTITQITDYPWDGRVTLRLTPDEPRKFTLHLRIPGWCARYTLQVNGSPMANLRPRNGYVAITRAWRAGDEVLLNLDMPVQLMRAHPSVRQMTGRVAVQRGPLVYCLESADNPISPLDRISLPLNMRWRTEHRPELLGGVTVLRGRAQVDDAAWRGGLYAPAQPVKRKSVEITAVPYCVWDNRAPGEMRVWLRAEPANA
ncbi:MAG: glycoside hydrolase family 127 protein [Anaerolineae bacterium]|nr:glycoside hydrolase family 127 protein [Anaerolineae bacterium]